MRSDEKKPLRDLKTYLREIDNFHCLARNAESKNDLNAGHYFEGCADNCLVAAVNCINSVDDGIEFLRKHQLSQYLGKLLKFNARIINELRIHGPQSGPEPLSDITLTHAAWLIDEFVLAELNSNHCVDPVVIERVPNTKFWNEYCRAIECFIKREPYNPIPLKLKGYEKYWEPYLLLIEAITKELESDDALSAVEASFMKRNSDRRLIDWMFLDGDGERPVKWDFRLASLRCAARHYYKREI